MMITCMKRLATSVRGEGGLAAFCVGYREDGWPMMPQVWLVVTTSVHLLWSRLIQPIWQNECLDW